MLEALIPSDPNLLPSLKRRRLLPSGPDLIAPETSSHDTTFSSNSLTSYRNRLLSYTLPTYNSKPARLQPQNVARYGWMNQGRERIRCETCDAAWFLKGFDDPRLAKNPRTRRRMTDMFEEQLTQAHKKACPWRIVSWLNMLLDYLTSLIDLCSVYSNNHQVSCLATHPATFISYRSSTSGSNDTQPAPRLSSIAIQPIGSYSERT